jgi:glycosyltransferase involved in cell wall biosynthesis
MTPEPWVAVIGPSPDSRGGIARVLGQVAAVELPGGAPRLVLVPSFRGGGRLAKAAAWVRGWVRFALLCARRRPELAYVHISSGTSTYRKLTFVGLARALRVPVLLHVHPASFLETLESRTPAGAAARRCVTASEAVIALSPALADRIHAVAPAAIVHVVPNAPDVDESTSADPPEGRAPGRILFVGSFLDDKGVDVLLDAVEQIAARVSQLRLVLVGAGPAEDDLRTRASVGALAGRVELPGWLGGTALDAEYAKAAVFVLPSRTEGLPLALLEAMWHGVPCVGTAVGAVPELLADGAGVLVSSEDPAALADAMLALLADRPRATACGAVAAARVRERYAPSLQRASIRDLVLRYSRSSPPQSPRARAVARPADAGSRAGRPR